MANQFASISSAVSILKNWYQGPIVTQFNDQIPFYREIEKGKEKWNGQQVVRPVKVRRNPGIGAVSDGGTLPKIGQQTTQQAQIASKYNYLRFGITGPMIKASQGEKGAFVSAMEFEMTEGLNDLKSDVNRQIYWDGTSDLATVSANATASNSITVTGRESAEDGNKFLDVGMVIDVVRGTTIVAQAAGITAISGTTTATLTLDTPVSVLANDIVIRNGSFGNEVSGLEYTLDGGTSTIFNIDRAAFPVFQGNVTNANNAQLNFNLMKQPFNNARRRGNGKIDLMMCDYDTERFYEKLLIVDKRYVGKVKGDGTFASKDENYLDYAGTPIIPDKDSPQRLYFLDSKTWKKYVLAELEWADETGTYLIAQTSADAYEARLRLFFNIFCEKPSANAVLKGYISP